MKGNGSGSRSLEFKNRYTDEYSKVQRDRALTPEQRRRFGEALNGCKPTVAIEECADKFFRANKLSGPRKRPKRNTVFGHLQTRMAFVDKLISAWEITDTEANALLDSLKTLPKAERLENVRTLVGRLGMKEYVLWAYRNPDDATDPFTVKGTADGLLPCRLGLGMPRGTEYVGWGIGPDPGREVRAATAFDPGLERLASWEPGGRTKPDPGCRWPGAGLPEVVMPPPTFEHVAVDFKEVIAE